MSDKAIKTPAMNAASPTCPHCGTHEIEFVRRCHNSACTSYAQEESIYQGWKGSATSGEAAPIPGVAVSELAAFQQWAVEFDGVINPISAWEARAVLAAKAEQSNPLSPEVIETLNYVNDQPEVPASVPQPLAGVITLLETFARIGMTAEREGRPTPNSLLCSRFAAELRAFASPVAERAAAPASVPEADAILAARAEGRAEALEILTGLDAENGIDEYTGWSTPVSPDDEGSAYWELEKLHTLFAVDDKLHNLFDRAEAMYWEYLGNRDDAERMMQMVKRAPHFQPLHDFLAKHQAWDLMHDLQRAAETPSDAAPEVAQPAAQGESVDEEKLLELILGWENSERGSVATKAFAAIVEFIRAWGASQRQEGRRDMHETSMSVLGENCALVERLRKAERPRVKLSPEIKAALDKASETGALIAETPGGVIFINRGHDYGDTAHLECTACGGSGHIDDQKAMAERATPAPTATLSKQEIASLIEQYTGMTKRQDERAYADLVRLVDAVLDAAPTAGEPSVTVLAMCTDPAGGACKTCGARPGLPCPNSASISAHIKATQGGA